MTRVAIILIVLTLGPRTSLAQELDIFDPNDFLDPRDRGATFATDDDRLENPGRTFLLLRAYGGVVFDYQWHARQTRNDAGFAHVTANYYRGVHQGNVKLTYLTAPHEAHIPRWRITSQYGRYFPAGIEGVGADEKSKGGRLSARVLGIWSFERSTLHDVRKGRGGVENVTRFLYNHEFGLEVDAYAEPPKSSSLPAFVFSGVWVRRVIDKGVYADRVAFFYRFPEIGRHGSRLRFGSSIGIGTQRTDRWYSWTSRATGTATIEVPWIGSDLIVAVGPTYIPGGDRKFFGEIAVFVGRTLTARLGDLPVAHATP